MEIGNVPSLTDVGTPPKCLSQFFIGHFCHFFVNCYGYYLFFYDICRIWGVSKSYAEFSMHFSALSTVWCFTVYGNATKVFFISKVVVIFVILDRMFTFTKFQGDAALEFDKCKHPIQNNNDVNRNLKNNANLHHFISFILSLIHI